MADPNAFVDGLGNTRMVGTVTGPLGGQTIRDVLAAGRDAGSYSGSVVENLYLNHAHLDSPLDGNAQEITHIYNPTAGDSAATKDYVDTAHVAAFVDPTTATPAAICTALINAGLMAAS